MARRLHDMKIVYDVWEVTPLEMAPGDVIAWADNVEHPWEHAHHRIVHHVNVVSEQMALIYFCEGEPATADVTLKWAVWRVNADQTLMHLPGEVPAF
jgi:hypothetical protein